jgi:putative flavoprotein involved in K+ transport
MSRRNSTALRFGAALIQIRSPWSSYDYAVGMSVSQNIKVLILGAGPAGLSLGREMASRAISYLILEKEDEVGSTFAKMTESTTFGPWLNNTLPGSPLPLAKLLSRTTRPGYAQYLREYARQHELRVLTGVRVVSVQNEGNEFLVESEDGETFKSEILVNATGIFSRPHRPEYHGAHTSMIPSLHSAEYRSPETVEKLTGRKDAKVLIVGSGLSAGEILAELYESGCQVHLSHRGRIETWPSTLEETLLSPFSYLWENLSLRLGLSRPSNLRPRLRRGRQWSLLTSGKVVTHPDILRMSPGQVTFVDRSADSFDLILYATGYRPALDHLAPLISRGSPWVSGLESAEIPNLFFLGLPGSRTFRSEFLRGIREDVVLLGAQIADRLSAPKLSPRPPRPPRPRQAVSKEEELPQPPQSTRIVSS